MPLMTPEQRPQFAEQCVREGVLFRIEPHYLMGIAQLRSGISTDPDGARIGPFRLNQAEWDANRDGLDFTSEHITSWRRQCTVAAQMAQRAFDGFVAANNRNPSAKELYLQQFPNSATPTFDTDFQNALNTTAPLVDPAADAVMDDPKSISPIEKSDEPATGPLKKLDPAEVPQVPVPPGTPGMLTLAMLEQHWPNALPALRQGMANTSGVLGAVGINTPLRMAHFMAQCSHECGKGKTLVESLKFSAARMMQVFPKRFPDQASTVGFVMNERAYGNKVYNGRMGNRTGTDDGFNFRGRGLIQITGRDNYTSIGQSCGLPLVDNPDLAADPQHVLAVAGTIFAKLRCLPECDANNVARVSAAVNLGNPNGNPAKINGLDDRRAQLAIWRQALGA